MPRQRRYHVPGDLYHVIARGNHQQDIFHHESDYRAYLFYLEKYALECSVVIHTFALMTNHVHLLLQEGEQPLGAFMKGVQQSYTQYINKRYEQTGHLFQGRYKAFRVIRDEHLWALVDYIHLNPVKAGMVTNPAEYRWSSYRSYHGGGNACEGPAPTEEIMAVLLGSRAATIPPQTSSSPSTIDLPTGATTAQRAPEAQEALADSTRVSPLDTVKTKVMRYTGISEQQIINGGRSQEIATARWLLIWASVKEGVSPADLARYLGQSRAAVTKAFHAVQADVSAQGPWASRIAEYARC